MGMLWASGSERKVVIYISINSLMDTEILTAPCHLGALLLARLHIV